jgi:phosphoribosylaminoimidazole carboxylase PurE protein
MNRVDVGILMGSKTDLPVMQEAANILKEFGVAYEIKVLSAHRTPKETAQYAEDARKNGIKVLICGAGGSAALAGVVAAHTNLPVIGVPVDSTPLLGLDSLLSTVQMPPGIPVAGVAIGAMGAKNAALLALRMMGISDSKIAQKLDDYREDQRKKILNTKLEK